MANVFSRFNLQCFVFKLCFVKFSLHGLVCKVGSGRVVFDDLVVKVVFLRQVISPCFEWTQLHKTDKKASISGDPPTCLFMCRSEESENNVKHCGRPADSSGCQA